MYVYVHVFVSRKVSIHNILTVLCQKLVWESCIIVLLIWQISITLPSFFLVLERSTECYRFKTVLETTIAAIMKNFFRIL